MVRVAGLKLLSCILMLLEPEAGGIVDWAVTSTASALAQRKRGGRAELHTDWLTRVPSITVTLG